MALGKNRNEAAPKQRCFMHTKYSDYTIPIEHGTVGEGEMKERVISRALKFRNYTLVTDDPEVIGILEKRALEDSYIVEIAVSRQQEAITMLKTGVAQPHAIGMLLDVRRVAKE